VLQPDPGAGEPAGPRPPHQQQRQHQHQHQHQQQQSEWGHQKRRFQAGLASLLIPTRDYRYGTVQVLSSPTVLRTVKTTLPRRNSEIEDHLPLFYYREKERHFFGAND
jgi:hypothetical protein